MAVIGTFSSFTTARLAIYASQASLNVTGNNIANTNTKGYTRQRMDLVSLYSYGTAKFANIYNTNIGYGVLTNGASQLRDPYLDIRYRDENSKLGQKAEKLDGLSQMGRILDEVGKGDDCFGVIEHQLGLVKQALQNLSTKVDSKEYDDLVRGEAETLTSYFHASAEELQTIWDTKKMELGEAVDDVNKLLTDIRDLNEKIRIQGLYKDKALELRDARNVALDELSEYLKINVEYSMERIDQFTEVEKLTVTLADYKGPDGKPVKLVDGIYGGQISIQEKEPLMNPDYDPTAIKEAQDAARKVEETKDPFSGADWQKKVADKKKEYGDKARADATAANQPDSDYWKARLKELEDSMTAVATAKAKNENPVVDGDPDSQAKQDAAVAAAVAEAKTKAATQVEKERQETIDGEVRKAEARAEREVKAEWENTINARVEASIQPVVEKSGKYLKEDGTATNDLYVKNADGTYATDADGNYIYNVKTFDNDKFLLQVEPLKDERGRLMIDPDTVSKRSEVVELNDTDLVGKLQAIRELLTEEGEYASSQDLGKTDEKRLSDDPNAAIKGGIPYYQKALDTLARKIAETFNEMNQMDPEVVYQTESVVIDDTTGNPVAGADPANPPAGSSAATAFLAGDNPKTYVMADGKTVTTARIQDAKDQMEANKKILDSLTATPAEKEQAQKDWDAANEDLLACTQALQDTGMKDPVYGFYDGGVLFSNNGNTNDASNITAANISIAIDWAEGPVRILNKKNPDYYNDQGELITESSAATNIEHMINVYDQRLEYYARDIQPDAESVKPMFSGSFREVYTAISGILGDDTYTTQNQVDSYELMTLDLDNDRKSVSGVDLNEEATSMMQFSKSYAAACKLLTTLDSMLDKLINGTI